MRIGRRRFLRLLLLPAILLLAACSGTGTDFVGHGDHDCLDCWGAPAADLIPILESPPGYKAPAPGGWARRVRDVEDFDALVSMRVRLAAAMGRVAPPVGWEGGGPPANLSVLAAAVENGLNLDDNSHADTAWLSPGGSGTTAAKTRAQTLWALLHEALDM